MPFAGVDAHKRYSRVVVKDEAGSILCRATLQNDVTSFGEFFGAIDGPIRAVLEAGRDWGVIYDLLEGVGGRTRPVQSCQDQSHRRSQDQDRYD